MQASGRSAKVLGCIFRGPNPGRLESPLSDIFFFVEQELAIIASTTVVVAELMLPVQS